MSSNTHVEALISTTNEMMQKPLTPDFNYSYTQSGMPGMFTIFKRSSKDPMRSYPILQLGFGADLPFAEPSEIVHKVCEMYASMEFEYNKDIEKEANSTPKLSIKPTKSQDPDTVS
jgi:hypothetical protein